MSSSSFFFNKVSGKMAATSFRGETSRPFVMVMFHWMLIAVIFLHFFYIVSYLEGRTLCHGLTLVDLFQKSETDSQKRSYF